MDEVKSTFHAGMKPEPKKPDQEYGWLIETKFACMAFWLFIDELDDNNISFTNISNRALRFARKQDAEKALIFFTKHCLDIQAQPNAYFVTEHLWMNNV